MSTDTPEKVQRLADYLREEGFDPVVTGVPGGSWEVAVEGEHVRAAACFVFRNGRTKRADGTCTVDGQPHPLVSEHDLRAFWDEHETPAADPEPEPAVLLEIEDPGGRPVPYLVQVTLEEVRRGTQSAGIEQDIRVGTCGGHWVIGIDMDGDGLRLLFTRYGHGWSLDAGRKVQVVAGGEDRSAEADGDISRALALLARTDPPKPGDPPPGSSPVRQQAGKRDLGVETRRRVVIRE
jgi:hypothetical protein